MVSVYQFNESEILTFFLVLLRVASFFVTWPVLGSEVISAPTKILFAFVVALFLAPLTPIVGQADSLGSMLLIVMAVRETAIGLMLGWIARGFIFSIRIAGEIVSAAMGLSNAQLFNPHFEGTVTAVEQFKVLIGGLIFLSIGGHHLLILGLHQSLTLLPVGQLGFETHFFGLISQWMQQLAEMGLKLSAPVFVAMFFSNLTVAIIGRAVPQINVLITSLPVNVLVGFLVLILSLPLAIVQIESGIGMSVESLGAVLRGLRGNG